jgi:hypothetical protein
VLAIDPQELFTRYLYLGTGVSFRFDGEGVALRKQLCVSGKPVGVHVPIPEFYSRFDVRRMVLGSGTGVSSPKRPIGSVLVGTAA